MPGPGDLTHYLWQAPPVELQEAALAQHVSYGGQQLKRLARVDLKPVAVRQAGVRIRTAGAERQDDTVTETKERSTASQLTAVPHRVFNSSRGCILRPSTICERVYGRKGYCLGMAGLEDMGNGLLTNVERRAPHADTYTAGQPLL